MKKFGVESGGFYDEEKVNPVLFLQLLQFCIFCSAC